MSDESLIEFPCDFPIKAMGLNEGEPDFESHVVELVRKHCPDFGEAAVKSRDSKGGKYLAVTITVRAQNQEQLDNIYRELTACERVVMAL